MSVRKDEILDREALAHLRAIAGSPADNVSVRFVHLFLEEAVSMIDSMRRAATAGDCAQVAMTAHALRGAAGFVGATRLIAAAGVLEHTADADDGIDLGPLVLHVNAELDALRPVVLAAITPAGG